MKYLLALLLFASIAEAQTYIPLAVDSSYATTDTSKWVGIRADRDYSLVTLFQDSANVTIRLDYAIASVANTSHRFQSYSVVADSTQYADTLGTVHGYTLRRGSTDNIPGGTYLRMVVTRKLSKNPVRPTANQKWSAGVWENQ